MKSEFPFKTYTLTNKIYDPTPEIQIVVDNIHAWLEDLHEIANHNEQREIHNNIHFYINHAKFPNSNDVKFAFYEKTREGWTLIKKRLEFKRSYPMHYYKVVHGKTK